VEEADGRRYNTATLFDRRGRLLGRQRKHNLGNLERRGFGVVPGEGWQVWDTDFGRLGAPVCIDFWGQPEAARRLRVQGWISSSIPPFSPFSGAIGRPGP